MYVYMYIHTWRLRVDVAACRSCFPRFALGWRLAAHVSTSCGLEYTGPAIVTVSKGLQSQYRYC